MTPPRAPVPGKRDGSAVGADEDALRLARRADEHFHLIGCLAAQGARERQFFVWNARDLVGVENSVFFRPLIGERIQTHPDNAFRTWVEGEVAVFVDNDDAVADAVKNGLHEADLMLQFVNGFAQRVPGSPDLGNAPFRAVP